MPIYEYTCLDCRAEFETIRSIKDADSPIACDKCHSERTYRKISLFNASSDGRSLVNSSCSSCSGGSCSSCESQ